MTCEREGCDVVGPHVHMRKQDERSVADVLAAHQSPVRRPANEPEAPHCRHHPKFRSDCSQCVRERASL